MLKDPSNQAFDLAWKFINQTSTNIFLTGKAGTGKTTFLKFVKENTHKKIAIVAPTGVAAINAGGVTIHSFFQLPLGYYIPVNAPVDEGNFYTRSTLFKQLKLNNQKRRLIQEIDLLVIDEVSMVRADLIDAIDVVLRGIRKNERAPFGGVQILFIGDLFQLPPVIEDQSWNILKQYYKGQFFFNAWSLRDKPPVYIELKKIYRQNQLTFINLLNNIRNNEVTKEDIDILNSYYKPDFKPGKSGEYIILTTHNFKAENINRYELEKLPGKLYSYEALLEKDFNERNSPAEFDLTLKVGAQVMFIRNDKGEERRYYNGKIGIVSKLSDDEVYVTFPGESSELKVQKEIWRNVRYQYNKVTDHVDEEVIGTFTQYPLRLAWAITIHKSQGLTFEKAIIDAGESFAPGQVYVALSRLTSLEGLVLKSPIDKYSISTDQQAKEFSSTETEEHVAEESLSKGRYDYILVSVQKAFDFNVLLTVAGNFLEELYDKKIPNYDEAIELFKNLNKKLDAQNVICGKFHLQLNSLFIDHKNLDTQQILSRVESAKTYFQKFLQEQILEPLKEHMESTRKLSKVKKYLQEIEQIKKEVELRLETIERVSVMSKGICEGRNFDEVFESMQASLVARIQDNKDTVSKVKGPKLAKGETQKISLTMFKNGKTIEQIAEERGFTPGTIEGHLISYIGTGSIEVSQFVNEQKLQAIKEIIHEIGTASSLQIKERLGEEYSYTEIKAAIQFVKTSELEV